MNYVSHSEAERQAMLQRVGAASIENLFETVPAQVRFPKLDLPKPLSELEVTRLMIKMAASNDDLNEYA